MPQSFVCSHHHMVFSTKNRAAMITPDIQPRLYEYLGGVFRGLGGVLLEAGGMPDHIHLFGSIGKRIAISDALREIKAESSLWVHKNFRKHSAFAWQAGYAAFSASYSARSTIRRYIQTQEKHHRKMTYQEEFITLLDRHEMEYDPQYLWD